MRYCEHCGTPHECEVADVTRVIPEVEIARIQAERDIKVAQLSARQDANWNETRVEIAGVEADAMVEAAAVEGEVIAAAIEASDVQAEPIEIVAPDIINDNDVQVDDALPETEGSPVPTLPSKTSFGMW